MKKSFLPEMNQAEKQKRYGKSVAAKFFDRRKQLHQTNSSTSIANNSSTRGQMKTTSEVDEFQLNTRVRIQRCLNKLKQQRAKKLRQQQEEKEQMKHYNRTIRLRNKKLYDRQNAQKSRSPNSTIDQNETQILTKDVSNTREKILKSIQKLQTNHRYAKNRKAKQIINCQIKELQKQLVSMTDPNFPRINQPETSPDIMTVDLPVIITTTNNSSSSLRTMLSLQKSSPVNETQLQDDKRTVNLDKKIKSLHNTLVLHRRHPTTSDFTKLPTLTATDEMLLPCIHCGWKSICSRNWYLRIDNQCPKCLEKHYIRKVRHIRKECHSALVEREQRDYISSTQYRINTGNWF